MTTSRSKGNPTPPPLLRYMPRPLRGNPSVRCGIGGSHDHRSCSGGGGRGGGVSGDHWGRSRRKQGWGRCDGAGRV